jgi:hypothetical protein
MQRRPLTGRRPGRTGRANMKTRVAVAASALVLGGGAAAVVAASHGSAPSAARSASFSSSVGHSSAMSEWNLLNAAVSGWGSSMTTSMTRLASVSGQTLSQTTEHDKTLDVQRGIVVFASQRFLILESKNGSLHLWSLAGHTDFDNVADSTTGTTAMTASSTASMEAVGGGEMIPAVNVMAGGATTAQSLLTPSYHPQTVTVQVAGTDLTVSVTITENTASLSQTATVPASGSPVADPSTSVMSAWSTAGSSTSLSRGDLALVVGTRSHGLLHASIVLYSPLSASDVGGFLGGGTQPHPVASATVAGSHW